MKLKRIFKKSTKIAAASYVAAATVVGLSIVVDRTSKAAATLIVHILRDA